MGELEEGGLRVTGSVGAYAENGGLAVALNSGCPALHKPGLDLREASVIISGDS
jgi:hypothetical protein